VKILWLTENYYPNKGGMSQSCDRIVYNLRRQGIDIDVYHFTNRCAPGRRVAQTHGDYIPLSVDPDLSHTLNLAWNLIEAHTRTAPVPYTHIVCFGVNLSLMAAPSFSLWLGVPLVMMLRGNDFDANIFSIRKREVLVSALNSAAVICSVTAQKIPRIKALAPKVNIEYTPNGIDTNNWFAFPSDIDFAKNWRHEYAQDLRVIGFSGVLKAKKGVDFFIESLRLAYLESQVHLLLMGDVEPHITTMLNEAGIAHTLLPFRSTQELLPYYLCCDAIALPSFYDGMPNVLLEAGLLARPFIASNVDGMKDVLNDELAFLFEPGDIEGCRKALRRFCEAPPEELDAMGERLLLHIQNHFCQDRELANYLRIFHEL
jgi:glycosyltransferase involved in cell wall biosynthesis